MRFKKRTTFKNCVAGILQHQHQRHLRKTSLQNLQVDDCATVHIAYCGAHWEQAGLSAALNVEISAALPSPVSKAQLLREVEEGPGCTKDIDGTRGSLKKGLLGPRC